MYSRDAPVRDSFAGYARAVDPKEPAQREELLIELLRLQSELELSFVPAVIEPMLSLRLTMQQLKVLTILVTEPEGSTIRALSAAMEVSLATMSGIVDRLESQDMIVRALDPYDQRVRRVTVTAAGRETIQRLLAARPELAHAPLNRLSLEDLRALTQGIRALVAAMQEDSAG
ncbi:MarR family transcriptional regulator [Kocuria sp. WN036]|nr:MarR family transcriptional regulator [Kocuria salina]PAU90970.1 MarR family transcriptional regulator [Kocuria sp. WN036]THE18992.1 MarR family transcriptional regulator [Kocuria rosea]